MQLYDELKARGLIAQVTNEEEISEMIKFPRRTADVRSRRCGVRDPSDSRP